MPKTVRHSRNLSQEELAHHAGARTTVARMETLARNDMSVSALVRLLEAAGYDLKFVPHGHGRTPEDILAEQRMPDSAYEARCSRFQAKMSPHYFASATITSSNTTATQQRTTSSA
jgi:transcriptional regulator with XRE-family HTH domain